MTAGPAVGRRVLWLCAAVMFVQGAVGLLGFYFHVAANLHGPAPRVWDNFLFGAPAVSPLLFPNLVLLVCIGLWVRGKHSPAVISPVQQPTFPAAPNAAAKVAASTGQT